MTGLEIKKQKLLSSGGAVIIACDHGEFDGPIPGMINLGETVARINKNVDAVLMSPAMIQHTGDYFSSREAPLIVGRLNWNTVYCFHWEYKDAVSVEAFAPEEALSLGVEIALISLTLKTGREKQDARNIENFRKLTSACHRLGIPVIGEYFPACCDQVSSGEMHQQVKIGCRILAELGADMIKTFHTTDFREVVAGCPLPIFALGAAKLPTPLDALKLADKEINDGARGVVFGRNALQVDDPCRFQAALLEVVKARVQPEQAMNNAGLV